MIFIIEKNSKYKYNPHCLNKLSLFKVNCILQEIRLRDRLWWLSWGIRWDPGWRNSIENRYRLTGETIFNHFKSCWNRYCYYPCLYTRKLSPRESNVPKVTLLVNKTTKKKSQESMTSWHCYKEPGFNIKNWPVTRERFNQLTSEASS